MNESTNKELTVFAIQSSVWTGLVVAGHFLNAHPAIVVPTLVVWWAANIIAVYKSTNRSPR